jgi:hypothetical protein
MHLVYFDESGNSGNNLNDAEQPIFVLGALIVPETCWQSRATWRRRLSSISRSWRPKERKSTPATYAEAGEHSRAWPLRNESP